MSHASGACAHWIQTNWNRLHARNLDGVFIVETCVEKFGIFFPRRCANRLRIRWIFVGFTDRQSTWQTLANSLCPNWLCCINVIDKRMRRVFAYKLRIYYEFQIGISNSFYLYCLIPFSIYPRAFFCAAMLAFAAAIVASRHISCCLWRFSLLFQSHSRSFVLRFVEDIEL